MEEYKGSISVKFEDIPPVRLQTIVADPELNLLERLALSTKRRLFTLHNDWVLDVDNVSYEPGLNGKIKIPAIDASGNEIVFDGASIPLPWLVSLLTIGILRPLGVMLIASIVHDYTYKFGHLQKEDGTVVEIERHIADRLFKDIIATVNKLPAVAYIAWFFVRIGWLKVKYNNMPRGGKAPFDEYFLLLALLLLLITIGIQYSFGIIALTLIIIYVAFYSIVIVFGWSGTHRFLRKLH